MSKTRAEQGIILEWCKCKCHGSPSAHITADGKSQLSNFWGQVGHSRGVANLHNEGTLKSGLDCVPENGAPCVGRSGVSWCTDDHSGLGKKWLVNTKENLPNEAHALE